MNKNQIIIESWSNEASIELYKQKWPNEPELAEQYAAGGQCGACSFFAPFNYDYGLCCHDASRHYLETVFEHFTCPVYEAEGWGPHSFATEKEFHCRCEQ